MGKLEFSATIKSLQFVDISENRALIEYGGLMKYLSQFNNLSRLSIRGSGINDETALDLQELLQNQTNLEYLHIRDIKFLKSIPLERPLPEYSSLKKLKLFKLEASISLIPYIVSSFTGLEEFVFKKVALISSNASSTITAADAKLIDSLQALAGVKTDIQSITHNGSKVIKERSKVIEESSESYEDFVRRLVSFLEESAFTDDEKEDFAVAISPRRHRN